MTKIPEPDDIELIVRGREHNSVSSSETARLIEEYKKRPDYDFEVAAAEEILASLGVDARDYSMSDAKSLLDHWKRCVAELRKTEPGCDK